MENIVFSEGRSSWNKMILGIFALTTVLGVVQCGQLSVLHTSPNVNFQSTNDVLSESQVISVLQAMFGLQTKFDTNWKGLLAGSFFDRPKALVLLSISGIRADQLNVSSPFIYDTLEDDAQPLNMQHMLSGVEELSADANPVIFIELLVDKRQRVHLESGGVLPRVVNLQLPGNNQRIYVELHAIKETISTLTSNFHKLQSDTPDMFHFHVRGLERIVDRYGYRSTQMTQAVTSLQEMMTQAISAFRTLYADDVIILALTHSSSRQGGQISPVARRLLQQTTPSGDNIIADLNLAPEFTWMYPEIFNISLWFMVTFILIMFGVSWCIWFTDPGRDGIIYRMTTTHIKQA